MYIFVHFCTCTFGKNLVAMYNKNTRTLGAGQSLTSNFIYLRLNSDNIIHRSINIIYKGTEMIILIYFIDSLLLLTPPVY